MDSANSFVISPMTKRINLEAGQVYHGSITVSNPKTNASDIKFIVEISPFSVKGEEYSADFLNKNDRNQIVDWIKIDKKTGTLKPEESTKINYTLTVPDNAPAGGQYAALLVSLDSDENSSSGIAVENVFEMASVIYADVAGETKEAGEILDNYFPGFVTSIPFRAEGDVKNDGNVHEIAMVSLEVKSIFSSTPLYPLNGESGVLEETIMPETTKHISRDVNGISPLGIYTVKQVITYMGETSVMEKTVIACPVWFMVLLLLTLCSIIYSVYKSLQRRKRRKNAYFN